MGTCEFKARGEGGNPALHVNAPIQGGVETLLVELMLLKLG